MQSNQQNTHEQENNQSERIENFCLRPPTLPTILLRRSLWATRSTRCVLSIMRKCIMVKIGEAKKRKTTKIGGFINLVEICNMHHWLRGGVYVPFFGIRLYSFIDNHDVKPR